MPVLETNIVIPEHKSCTIRDSPRKCQPQHIAFANARTVI